MEIPMGTTPAAKVIRASPTTTTTNTSKNNKGGPLATTSAPHLSQDSLSTSFTEDVVGVTTPSIVGDIVEHQLPPQSHFKSNHQSSSGKFHKPSRFRRRQQQQQHQQHVLKHHPATGFPSLNHPLGTFVPLQQQQSTRNVDQRTILDDVDKSLPLSPLDPLSSTSLQFNEDDNIIQASSKNAQNILSNMSAEQIKQAQQELQDAISPEMVTFLKHRGKNKTQTKTGNDKTLASRCTTTTTTKSQQQQQQINSASIKKYHTKINEQKQEQEKLQEKERIAKLISSVQTPEDLDALFHAEMQQNHPLEAITLNDDDLTFNEDERYLPIAFDLLRSTSPRQALWAARTVCMQLQRNIKDSTKIMAQLSRAKWPTLLSVSLRCLLDKSITSTYLLHTYALQSLYYLTIIYAHPAHIVLVTHDVMSPPTGTSVYQHFFLDDAVPTPPLDVAYRTLPLQAMVSVVDESKENDKSAKEQPAAYAATSSTTYALKDGQDFQNDPLWTLLSKMMIIPRLACLLENHRHQAVMPAEAWVAICGILSMVGQRSPGAASVIVQHETILPCLLNKMLEHIHGEDKGGDTSEKIPYAVLVLLGTLARQSRVAAEGLPLEEILPPILSRSASCETIFATQQLALILWRTVLRYGVGLEAVASMLTISARHLALPYSNRFSLSTEFLSAYAQVLECVKIYRMKKNNNDDDVILQQKINHASTVVLASSTRYMASTIKLMVPQSSTPSDRIVNAEGGTEEDMNPTLRFRYNAARMNYLTCWFQLFEQFSNTTEDNISPNDYFSMDDLESILSALEAWADRGGDVERTWNVLCRICVGPSMEENWSMEFEAAAGAFLRGYLSLVASISSPSNGSLPITPGRFRNLQKSVIQRIFEGLKTALETSHSQLVGSKDDQNMARRGWFNQCHFAVSKFLLHAMSTDLITISSDLSLLRTLVFSLLARLSRGDESIAAVLFSSDAVFQTSVSPRVSSPISSLFLGELCGSDWSRKQLDHSFKLCHGFGLTAAGWGPFGLRSLLSALDQPVIPTETSTTSDAPLLPLGKLWLWQTLSGAVRVKTGTMTNDMTEAADVISAVLTLLSEEEEAEDTMRICGYCNSQQTGSKLYYVMNVSLQVEEVLSDERIIKHANNVLDRYLIVFGSSDLDGSDFCRECRLHAAPSSKAETTSREEPVDEEYLKGQQMLEKFVKSEGTTSSGTSAVSPEELRALEAFVEDMARSYREYGAQFDFCTKCIRACLFPAFPVSIRCRMLQELDDMLHLLTLPKEDENNHEVSLILEKSIAGGVSSVDESVPDTTEILNKAVSILCRVRSRSVGKYMTAYCVALLARNLASSLQDRRLQPIKARLERLDPCSIDTICRATALTRKGGGTKSALVEGVLKALSEPVLMQEGESTLVDAQYVQNCLDQYDLIQ
jgi:hypothetical protein